MDDKKRIADVTNKVEINIKNEKKNNIPKPYHKVLFLYINI